MHKTLAVVIPCYRVTAHIADVVAGIGPEVSMIFAVDDACPEGSGQFIRENITDPRVHVLFHEHNRGVGGAVMSGYRAAMEAGADIVVKVDGDGQMEDNPEVLCGHRRQLQCIEDGGNVFWQ